jgi:hypothetical protein
MEKINLGSLIEQAITRVTRNRIGEKPPVFVTLSPALTQVPWKDSALKRFLQFFLYESLLTSDADAAIEISLRRRSLLKDLTAFVGIQPSYWVQLRISGRGLKVAERLIEDLFAEVGYRCEEWVGMDGSRRPPGNLRRHRCPENENGLLPGVDASPAQMRFTPAGRRQSPHSLSRRPGRVTGRNGQITVPSFCANNQASRCLPDQAINQWRHYETFA